MHVRLCTHEAVGLLALMMSFLILFGYLTKKRNASLSIIFFGIVPSESFDFFFTFSSLFLFVIGLIFFVLYDYLILFSLKLIITSLSILITVATLSLLFPLFGFIIALLSTASLVFSSLPDYSFLEKIKLTQKSILFNICHILKDLGILDFLSACYLVIWCLPTKKFFKLFLSFFLISIFYVLISRYYFLASVIDHHNFTTNQLLLIYLCLILGLIILYLRLILNLSLITVNYALNYHKELLSPNVLLAVEGDGNPMPDSTPPPTGPKTKQFIFFQRNHNNVHNIIPNAAMNRRMGLGGLFCTLCIGGGTLYYAHKSLQAQNMNNFEMTRQNDATEVELGIMTRDEYLQRYKTQPPKS